MKLPNKILVDENPRDKILQQYYEEIGYRDRIFYAIIQYLDILVRENKTIIFKYDELDGQKRVIITKDK